MTGLTKERRAREKERRERACERDATANRLELHEARMSKIEKAIQAFICHTQGGRRDESEGGGEELDSCHQETKQQTETMAPTVMEDKCRTLEISLFSGEDAYGWVTQLERYFQLKGVTEEVRLQAIVVAMEGRALRWYQWLDSCTSKQSWEIFKIAVIRRFQPALAQNRYEVLLNLKQEKSVKEFREQFKLYAGPLRCTSPEYLKGIFLCG